MKLNNTLKFKNIALSALMLTAIAAPISANAAANPDQATSKFIKTEAISVAPTLISFSDPLELAKKYAPETVADWENTLNRYNSLRPVKTLSIEGQKADASSEQVKGEAGTIRLEQAGSNLNIKGSIKAGEAIPSSKLDKSEVSGRTTIATFQIADGSISLEKSGSNLNIKGIKVGEAIPDSKLDKSEVSGRTTIGTFQIADDSITLDGAKKDGLQAVTAAAKSEGLSALLQGQIALSKAVESADSNEIKSQLANLLKEFKLQITQLEAAAK